MYCNHLLDNNAFYSSSDESGIEDKSQISDFSMTSSKTSVTTPLSPVHEVKESPNHKMSTKSSELVDCKP